MDGDVSWEAAARRHEGLVTSVVRDLGITGAAAEDARQEGLIVIRKVALRYDKARNAAFSTFCRRVLVRHLVKHRKSTNMIRVPSSTLDKIKALKKDPGKSSPATAATVASVERALAGRRVAINHRLSIMIPAASDESGAVELADEVEWLRKAVLKIPPRPRQVLIGVLGLFGNPAATIPEVARDLEVSPEAADELFSSACRDLVYLTSTKEQ